MSDFVVESYVNYHEILRRGGTNGGDEDFTLFRCPTCGRIYLIDYEVDTVFLDADDLTKRVSVPGEDDEFPCTNCGAGLASRSIWAAIRMEDAAKNWRVTWENIQSSPWAWAVKPKHNKGQETDSG